MRNMDWQLTRIGAVGAMASFVAFGRGALRRSGSCRSISGMALACLIVVGADAAATASPMRSGIAPDAPPGAVEIVAADRERAGESGVEVAGAEPSAERAEVVSRPRGDERSKMGRARLSQGHAIESGHSHGLPLGRTR